jgi:truncated hemoglobin YjbI
LYVKVDGTKSLKLIRLISAIHSANQYGSQEKKVGRLTEFVWGVQIANKRVEREGLDKGCADSALTERHVQKTCVIIKKIF